MVEFRAVDLAHRVAMGVNMDETDRPVVPQCLQDRKGDRMVAADRQRPHPGCVDARVERRNVLDAAIEAEARAHRHVADIGRFAFGPWNDAEGMIVGADALDLANRAGAEAGPRPIGDAEIHRHPDQRDTEPAKIRQIGGVRAVRQIQQGRYAGKRHRPPVVAAEHQRQRLPEFRRRHFSFLGAFVFGAQCLEFRLVEHLSSSASGRRVRAAGSDASRDPAFRRPRPRSGSCRAVSMRRRARGAAHRG